MKGIIINYKKLPIPVRAVLWLTVCTFLQKGISVITIPIFTRVLTTEEYGQFSVFISWENICQLFTSLSLHTGVFNSAMIQNENRHDRVISSYLGLSSMLTIFAFFLYLTWRNIVNQFVEMNSIMVVMMFINLFFAPAYNLWLAKQRYEYHYQKIVIYTVLTSIISPVISFVWVVFSKERALARIISMTITSCLFYIPLYIHILFCGKCCFDKELWKKAALINIPLIPHFLSGTILNQADRLMINTMVGKSEAGIYSVAYSAAMLLQLVISSVNTSIIPWLYNKLKINSVKEIKGILNLMILMMAAAVTLFMLFAPECMKLLASEEYSDAVWIFPPLTVSVYFIFIYNLFCDVELFFEKSLYIAFASCVTAGLNLFLNYICIPVLGYTAAGYTTLISYIIYAGIHYCCMKHVISEKNVKSPIDTSFVLALSVCVLLISFVIKVVYKYTYIRFILGTTVILMIVINKNKIKERLKKVRRN